jgi:antitoxin CptB
MNPADPYAERRRRLLWRASHRGIREMDLLLGGYARRAVAGMDARQLDELEAIVTLPDQDMLSWIMGQEPVPPQHASGTLSELIAYRP